MTANLSDTMNGEPIRGVICAAGGILSRQTPHGPEVLVIHRSRYGDWCLPKGKLQEGESWQEAALREVREETGCRARITAFAGSISYQAKDVPKLVLFWNMVAEGECAFQPSEEVGQVAWLTPRQAVARLDHPTERDLLMQVYPARKTRRFMPSRLIRFGYASAEYRRLAGTLEAYRLEFESLAARSQLKKPTDQSYVTTARALLNQAEAELEKGNVDEGWKCLNTAQRLALLGLDAGDDLLIAIAQTICEEADKLSQWRQNAIKAILSKEAVANRSISAERVYVAAGLRDEQSANIYFKMSVLREQMSILLLILGLVVALVLLALIGGPLAAGDSRLMACIVLFGMMGAALSAIFSLVGTSTQSRIPEHVVSSWVTLMRPVLGAAAALAVYAFLESKLISGIQVTTPITYLAISFVAGFSERLVIRAVETVTGKS